MIIVCAFTGDAPRPGRVLTVSLAHNPHVISPDGARPRVESAPHSPSPTDCRYLGAPRGDAGHFCGTMDACSTTDGRGHSVGFLCVSCDLGWRRGHLLRVLEA